MFSKTTQKRIIQHEQSQSITRNREEELEEVRKKEKIG
jgi:hypothetical protein